MITLDEMLAENTSLREQVQILSRERDELRAAASPDVAAKLKAETGRADGLQAKLDAANKELTELRGKALDVDQRAAAMVKALGIAGDLNEASGEQQPKAGESHLPGSWQAEAEKRFQK